MFGLGICGLHVKSFIMGEGVLVKEKQVSCRVEAGFIQTRLRYTDLGSLLLFLESKYIQIGIYKLHSNVSNITHVAIKVHVIVRRFIVLTWMHDDRELV